MDSQINYTTSCIMYSLEYELNVRSDLNKKLDSVELAC